MGNIAICVSSLQKTKSIDKNCSNHMSFTLICTSSKLHVHIKECLVDKIVLLSQSKYYVGCFNSLKHNYLLEGAIKVP